MPTEKAHTRNGRVVRTVAARAAQVIVVMVATGVCASCSRSSNGPDSPRSAVSGEQSVRLEVDDRVVDLPRATLVTCVDDGRNGYRFRWTGSNMLVPRHPWDEDRHGSQIRVDFQRDPRSRHRQPFEYTATVGLSS